MPEQHAICAHCGGDYPKRFLARLQSSKIWVSKMHPNGGKSLATPVDSFWCVNCVPHAGPRGNEIQNHMLGTDY